jgi:hypothetical protein
MITWLTMWSIPFLFLLTSVALGQFNEFVARPMLAAYVHSHPKSK